LTTQLRFFAAISAIIVIAGMAYLSQRSGVGVPNISNSVTSQKARLTSVNDIKPVIFSSSLRKMLDASSAIELISSLQNHASPGTETYVRVQVALACEPSLGRQTSRPKSESQNALISFKKSFCAKYTGTISSEQLKLLSLPESDPYNQAYGMASELFEAIDKSPQDPKEIKTLTEQLDAMLVSKDSQMESLVAAETLKQAGVIAPTTTEFARNNGWRLKTEDVSQAQFLSAQMKACRNFGGCGVNQLMTMKICSEQSSCALGATTESVWRKVYSPTVYNAAMQLATYTPAF